MSGPIWYRHLVPAANFDFRAATSDNKKGPHLRAFLE